MSRHLHAVTLLLKPCGVLDAFLRIKYCKSAVLTFISSHTFLKQIFWLQRSWHELSPSNNLNSQLSNSWFSLWTMLLHPFRSCHFFIDCWCDLNSLTKADDACWWGGNTHQREREREYGGRRDGGEVEGRGFKRSHWVGKWGHFKVKAAVGFPQKTSTSTGKLK